MTEINDAGILIREDTIEAIGPRSGMTRPPGRRKFAQWTKQPFLVL